MLDLILFAALAVPPFPEPPKVAPPKCSCTCGCATSGVCSCAKPKIPAPPKVSPPTVKESLPVAPTIKQNLTVAPETTFALDPALLPTPPTGKRWEAFRCYGQGKGCEYRLADVPQAVPVQQYEQPTQPRGLFWRR